MAAIPHYECEIEYEVCYFENGKIITTRIMAINRQDAMDWYLGAGKHKNDLYSIRPDE